MKIFLDVGAHRGQTLKIALEEKYHFDKIYCFEPVIDCCNSLKQFIDKRITVCEYGLWNKDCTKKIYNPESKGASVFEDKFPYKVSTEKYKFASASKWFRKNIGEKDNVYLKLNCEGSEIIILEDLIKSGEYKKIDVLMVDFDVRKIPSQKDLMPEMKKKLKKLEIPLMFFIDEYKLGPGTHSYFTHLWLDESLKKEPINKVNLDKTRADLVNEFKGIGAEIGVEQGEFSEIICKNKSVKKLYSIDAWKAYRGYRDHTRQEKLNRFYDTAKKRLAPYNCEIVRKFSRDAANDFMDNSLDFVYIDANHNYQHVYDDLTMWVRKVKKGGIVSGHDYIKRKGQREFYAVVYAVDDFVKANKIEELFIYRKDSPASWMFIKK